nr:MAG: hypothetical protein 3 [Hangzhou yanvirus-like virus 1]
MQQNTLIFQRANPLQQLTGLARAIALPHEYAPERFPSFPALERTAVIGFNSPFTVTVPSSGMRGLLFRQAATPLWLEYPAGASTAFSWGYTCGLMSEAVDRLAPGAEYDLKHGIRAWSTSGGGNFMNNLTGNVVPTQTGYPIIGLDLGTGPAPWFYCPPSGTIMVNLSADAGTLPTVDPAVVVNWQRWSAPGEVVDAAVVTPLIYTSTAVKNLYASFTSSGGWFRPQKLTATTPVFTATSANFSLCVSVTNGVATIVGTGGTTMNPTWSINPSSGAPSLVPWVAPPEFLNSVLPYSSTRTTAAAALFTNVTKVLNKEGTVLCGRLNPTTQNPWEFSTTTLSLLHPAEKQYLNLESGMYTYCPPSTDLAAFWDYTLPDNGFPARCPVHRLDNDALVNAFVFSDPDGGTNLAVNLDWHLEFRSTSSLWQIGLSTVPLEALHAAQLTLAAAGYFFNNEDHKTVLSKVIPVLTSTAKKLIPALADLHPVTKTAYRGMQAVLSSQPRKTPPPTTLSKAERSKNVKKGEKRGRNKPKGKKK